MNKQLTPRRINNASPFRRGGFAEGEDGEVLALLCRKDGTTKL